MKYAYLFLSSTLRTGTVELEYIFMQVWEFYACSQFQNVLKVVKHCL
jgi:hypothetical protein